ncbi:MAG: M15 family metallopeptidase [Parachlamydiaceae bacterium]
MYYRRYFFSILCMLFLSVGFASIAAHDLVELRMINPRIRIEMRYATDFNVLGHAIYPFSGCFLVREVAEKLSRVQEELERKGYGLKVYDAYRPCATKTLLSPKANLPEITTEMYFVTDFHGHHRGTAVDVGLVCLSDGNLEMPTDFNVYNERTSRSCQVWPPHVYHNIQILESTMKRFGFIPSQGEWWHFDYYTFRCYPMLDISFEELANEVAQSLVDQGKI